MTHFGRYRLAFLLSILTMLGFFSLYLNLPDIKKKSKEHQKSQVVKIALIHPVVVKKEKPKVEKKVVKPKPKPKPKKIVKKVIKKSKKIAKKHIIKHKVKPKKVTKPVVKHKVVKPKQVVKKTPVVPEPIVYNEPIYQEPIIYEKPIYKEPVYREPQPIVEQIIEPKPIMQERVQEEPLYQPAPIQSVPVTVNHAPPPPKNNDNGEAKRAFLKNIRSQIQNNKKYPKRALRRHIEGDVKVRFDINAGGEVNNIRFINGKSIFHKSIRKTLQRTFPVGIPANMQGKLPIYDVSVTLHFNIR